MPYPGRHGSFFRPWGNLCKCIQALPSGDVKKLKGDNELYRLRVGDYRVVYKIDDGLLLITVVNAGNRGQIYREL